MSYESAEIAQFRTIDLPHIPIHSDFESSDSSDLDESTGFSNPITPATPNARVTPATPSIPAKPPSQLASSVTFGFSEPQAATFTLPTPKISHTKKYRALQKGHPLHKRRVFHSILLLPKSLLCLFTIVVILGNPPELNTKVLRKGE